MQLLDEHQRIVQTSRKFSALIPGLATRTIALLNLGLIRKALECAEQGLQLSRTQGYARDEQQFLSLAAQARARL